MSNLSGTLIGVLCFYSVLCSACAISCLLPSKPHLVSPQRHVHPLHRDHLCRRCICHHCCPGQLPPQVRHLSSNENDTSSITRVKEGNVAIYFSNGALLDDITGPGVHWSTPFVTTVHQVFLFYQTFYNILRLSLANQQQLIYKTEPVD